MHLIPKQLDPDFFNITYMIKNEMDDERMPIASVILSGSNQKRLNQSLHSKGFNSISIDSQDVVVFSMKKDQLRKRSNELWQFNGNRAFFTIKSAERVSINRKVFASMDYAAPAVGADIVHQQLNVTGTGVNVAILDSGVDRDHADFYFENGQSKIAVDKDFTCHTITDPTICDNTPLDLNGHGTHVAGIALGTGAAKNGTYKGIAPGATLLNVKVMNKDGFGLESDLLKGMEVAVLGTNLIRGDEPDIEADVISLSLGAYIPESPHDNTVKMVNRIVSQYGVPVVVAAGNIGLPFYIGSPGNAEKAITVGAITKIDPYSMTGFSSRGPTSLTHRIKPDISAPGMDILSACSLKTRLKNCSEGFPYLTMSGTSMATPVVSGTVALMIEHERKNNITLSPDEIKDRLLSSATLLYPQTPEPKVINAYTQGSGMLKIDDALEETVHFSPANLNLGKHPHDTNILTGKISLVNTGSTEKHLDLSCMVRDVATKPYSPGTNVNFDHTLTITPSSVTLLPGETKTLVLTVDLSQLPVPQVFQVYNGFLFAKENKVDTCHAILGFTKTAPLYDLRIISYDLNGQTPDFPFFMIYSPENHNHYYHYPNGDTATFKVPKGIYNIVMGGFNHSIDKLFFVSENEVTVDGSPIEVVLDARKTRPVKFNLEADLLATETVQRNFVYNFYQPEKNYINVEFGRYGADLNVQLFSNKPPTIGSVQIFNHWIKSRSPIQASKVFYNWIDERERVEPFELTVTTKDLQRAGLNHATFNADIPQKGNVATLFWAKTKNNTMLGMPSPFFSFIVPTHFPSSRIEYYTPNILGCWNFVWPKETSPFHFDTADHTMINGILMPGKFFKPGETRIESWLKRSLNSVLTSVERKQAFLVVNGHALKDPFGHTGDYTFNKVKFSASAYVNNEPSASTPTFYYRNLMIPVPESGDAKIDIELHATADPEWSKPQIETLTQFQFNTSGSVQGKIAIPQTSYLGKNQNTDNRIVTNGKLKFDIPIISTTGKPVKWRTITVQLSIDDGISWFKVDEIEHQSNGLEIEAIIPMTTQGETIVSTQLKGVTTDNVKMIETIKRAFVLVRK